MGDIEKKEKQSEVNSAENKEKNNGEYRVKVGTVGNFLLGIVIVLIILTSFYIYSFLHAAKDNYDEQIKDSSGVLNDENEKPETIANIIDSALSNVTTSSSVEGTTTDVDSTKVMNEKLIVLYNGLILDTSKMDEITLQYIDATSEEKDKYVITYSNYENYSYKEDKLGTLSEPIYDGLLQIENVGKVAISENYNAIPRNIKVVNTIPKFILDNNSKLSEYDAIKTLIVDLDGNQTNEYILVLANKSTGFSKIILVDSKGVVVSELASIEKSRWNNTNTEYYLSINNLEVVDVDNDGIMEILVEIPHYEGGPTISLLKYKNGELQGKTGIKCSLMP